MNATPIRTLIPIAYADLSAWPRLDEAVMNPEALQTYTSRRKAVEMYAVGSAIADITEQTGKSKAELYRLIRRCMVIAPDGQIYGFRALAQWVSISRYTRKSEINHAPGSGSGGCTGALTQLLSRFPEIDDLIRNLYFKRGGGMHEARIPLRALHDRVKVELRKLGFTDAHWPFNTANCGYKTLCNYCNTLRETEPGVAVGARSGADAKRRSDTMGRGEPPLLPCIRPYSVVQLDYHKVDAASVFLLENDHGRETEVPLSRWHFGLIVDEKSNAALGFSVALELTPSGDSALEVVSSALSTQAKDFADILSLSKEHVLINQLMPELSHQGFSSLKVDNGWANAAHEVVNNIMSTVGCAVNFGPTRAWSRRNLIERIFGELTRRGLQRLPSTHGKGPGDTKIDNPNVQAAAFRISLSDLIDIFKRCLREHNLSDTEGKQWTSPLQCLKAAYSNPRSGFFSQPLPKTTQSHMALMMHMEEVTVRGNVQKGERPFFRLDRHRHTNPVLAQDFSRIGQTLIAYVDRRLARVVYATVKDTGEQLGRMMVSGPWADSDCSWRDRKLMSRAGMARRYAQDDIDPLEQVKQEKMEQLKALKKSRRMKSSKTGLDIARIEAQQKRANCSEAKDDFSGEADSSSRPMAPAQVPAPAPLDPFGIYNLPYTGAI